MRLSEQHFPGNRSGAVLILVSLLMIVLLAMVAFAIDVGYIVLVRQQLQNASDSGALAGAGSTPLLAYEAAFSADSERDLLRTLAVNNSHAEAKKFAQEHEAGATKVSVKDTDIQVGYYNSALSGTGFTTNIPLLEFPNAVRVTTRRDESVSPGRLKLLFAHVLGVSHSRLQATATAAYESNSMTGFEGKASGRGSLLPIALDLNAWIAFQRGLPLPSGYSSVDDYSWDAEGPTQGGYHLSNQADGINELKGIYPNKNAPGSFGLVDIGPDANDAPTFQNWIEFGQSQSDVDYLTAHRNGIPGSSTWVATLENPAVLKTGPGLKASNKSALEAILGQPRTIPLFSSVRGNGQNATYTVVGFVGVTLVDFKLTGNKKYVTFQPITVVDPWSASENGGINVSEFIYRPLRLIQ